MAQEDSTDGALKNRLEQRKQLLEEKAQQREAKKAQLESQKAGREASREAAKASRREQKCTRIQSNIGKRVTKYTEIRARRVTKFAAMQDRLNKLATHIEEKRGLDVSALRTAIAGLQPKVDNYLAKLDAFIAKLGDVQNTDCDGLSDNARSHIQSAGTELQAVKVAQKELGQYYRTTVLGALKALKNQAQVVEDTESEE